MSQDIRSQLTLSRYPVAAPQWLTQLGLSVFVGLAYFLAARLSIATLSVADGITVFWPAAGVATGALIALGRDARWPVVSGVLGATIVANLLSDRSLWSAIVFGLCDAGEAVLAAKLIDHRFGSGFALDRLNNVLGLLVAAFLATAVSGVGGALGYMLFYRSNAAILDIWQHWFASDALGIIAFAPVLIGAEAAWRNPPTQREVAEGIAVLSLLGVVSGGVALIMPSGPWSVALPLALIFPLLLWLAARCSPVFSAVASFIIAIAIVSTMALGVGVFGDMRLPINDRIFAAGAGILAVSLCALVLAALFAERHQHESALEKSEERMRLAVTASRMGMFDWDLRTGACIWSEECYRILGHSLGEIEPSQTAWIAHIHPEDRGAAETAETRAKLEHKEFRSEYRIIQRDGAVRWVGTHGRFLYEGDKPVRMIGLKRDITDARQQMETQRVLVGELQHRTRNLMAVVQAIACQTLDTVDSLSDFERRFNRRLEALSRVQSLLSRGDDKSIALGALVAMELEAVGGDAFGDRIKIQGPEVPLRKSVVEMLALAIHELLTNAIKHGALANPTGRLSVHWHIETTPPDKRIVVDWIEQGIAPSQPFAEARRRGYGRILIEEALRYSLGADTTFDLGVDGLHCRISLPLSKGDR